MPKPATVEDEELSPVSPVEEQSTFKSFAEPTQTAVPVPETPSNVTYPEKTIYPGSVADIQRGFEELLINHPRFSNNSSSTLVNPLSCNHTKRSTEAFDPVRDHPTRDHPKMNSCSSTEIPVTRGAAARDRWFAELAGLSNERQCAIRNSNNEGTAPATVSVFSVYCNNCSEAIPDVHYHCSTCDDGDFDLCQTCVDDGVLCGGEDHWMIKRFVKSGKVINSTTETIAPKAPATQPKSAPAIPEDPVATRTCNSCIQGKSNTSFIPIWNRTNITS
jgi:next-to-BRCA1 protein 1